MAPPPENDGLPAAANLHWIERLHERWAEDPRAVPRDWRRRFRAGRAGDDDDDDGAPAPAGRPRPRGRDLPESGPERLALLQDRVDQLVRAYRVRGHRMADVDPLGRGRPRPPELDPAFYGFRDADLGRRFSCDDLPGPGRRTLGEILEHVTATYCTHVGAQFMHIDDVEARDWLQERMESTRNRIRLGRDEQLRILTRLTDATVFEVFVRRKFVGSKSFSLEGAETLIPLLDRVLERAGEQGVREVVMGMGHRGRLNVLANLLGKSPQRIFAEFMQDEPSHDGYRDVRYHLGYGSEWTTAGGRAIHLSLCFNPSHLGWVGPVVLGRLRAKQDRFGDGARERGMAVLIHGDAAFAGQGIVQETLNLGRLDAYRTGGTLHVIVDNQVGYTTPPDEGRSSAYPADVARMLQIPVFHVNGEQPEAVVQAVRLAMDFRATFSRDAVINLYCYRRHGHNEGDEPTFTQPLMYRRIRDRRPVRERYLEALVELGEVTHEEGEELAEERRERLQRAFDRVGSEDGQGARQAGDGGDPSGVWQGFFGGPAERADDPPTGVTARRLSGLLRSQTRAPEGLEVHDKLRRSFERREAMADGERPLDWSAAEALAFASLAADGVPVRLTGQDTARGTFSQRHAALHDQRTGERYVPLRHVAPDQAPVEIANSPLSEAGVLGFEYGYSLDAPERLVAWEAQYGDFANAAQVVIDQFVVSAEEKWRRLTGLVLLLPHGFEGHGPEHSSARIERFLEMAARDNVQVVVPTTPAQYFHVLRRQALRRWRKPLIVMTPKSLLRHKRCVSPLADLADGGFRAVLPDPRLTDPGQALGVVLCSGKVYYDLVEAAGDEDARTAVVRVEELHPFPRRELEELLARLPGSAPVVWAQEEPSNMGAAPFVRRMAEEGLLAGRAIRRVSRPAAASPASGGPAAHRADQRDLCRRALAAARPAGSTGEGD